MSLPVTPFYLYFIAVGALESHKMLGNIIPSINRVANLAIIIFISITFSILWVDTKNWASLVLNRGPEQIIEGPYTQASTEVFNFIRKNTGKDEVIAFMKPRVLMLLTDRKSIIVEKAERILDGRLDYLLIYERPTGRSRNQKSRDRILREVVTSLPRHINLIFQNVRFKLYRIKKIHSPHDHLFEDDR